MGGRFAEGFGLIRWHRVVFFVVLFYLIYAWPTEGWLLAVR